MGRFAAMSDGGIQEIALANAEQLAQQIQAVMQAKAPHGSAPLADGREPFYQSIKAEAKGSPAGFTISVETDQGDVANFIRSGHGDIYPVNAKALHWVAAGGEDVFVTHVGPLAPNPWEQEAISELQPLVEVAGNKIGVEVTDNLGGKL
jgi:hypothetical protein